MQGAEVRSPEMPGRQGQFNQNPAAKYLFIFKYQKPAHQGVLSGF